MDISTIKFSLEKHNNDIDDFTYINGNLVKEYCIDFDELARSLKGAGEFNIFTCECGISGCAGIEQGVLVKHENEFVEWYVIQPFIAHYTFSKQIVIDELFKFAKSVEQHKLKVGSTLYMMSGSSETLRILYSIT